MKRYYELQTNAMHVKIELPRPPAPPEPPILLVRGPLLVRVAANPVLLHHTHTGLPLPSRLAV